MLTGRSGVPRFSSGLGLVSGGLMVVSGALLLGCGVDPDDIVGTWVYADGTQVTLDCGNADLDGTYGLAGQTLTFVDGKGTHYDLVVNFAPGCDLGYNLEGNEIVLATTMVEGCYTMDPTQTALVSADYAMVYQGGEITISGDTTVTIQYAGAPEGVECHAMLTGSLTKKE